MTVKQISKPAKKTVTAAKKVANTAGNAVAAKVKEPAKKVALKKTAAATAQIKPVKVLGEPTDAKPTRKSKAANAKQIVPPTPEERYRMVELAAYYIAERNGFQGCASGHWALAEREIAAKLGR